MDLFNTTRPWLAPSPTRDEVQRLHKECNAEEFTINYLALDLVLSTSISTRLVDGWPMRP
jgi:hypothetical protein